uniref:Uncharacterized protein n=1 Tax=Chromera velia CCMP2878 TaxID=1169474 RepID=A0A0G4HFV5_9ALVE|eukprot:Cvel_27191.t1-p1 / transcript=Cvel_27191.t1 / gene=Cvel_27191 / organism=Chromera_velia_CCMP2878 / gene_product=hypothetical protein / transcript_product=hypothetical protein / location=Cvel_scaffold3357:4364-10537(+) / protein_length=872 / sequence_SO=supercontig / SO=protein_coding / is_pseudo=false
MLHLRGLAEAPLAALFDHLSLLWASLALCGVPVGWILVISSLCMAGSFSVGDQPLAFEDLNGLMDWNPWGSESLNFGEGATGDSHELLGLRQDVSMLEILMSSGQVDFSGHSSSSSSSSSSSGDSSSSSQQFVIEEGEGEEGLQLGGEAASWGASETFEWGDTASLQSSSSQSASISSTSDSPSSSPSSESAASSVPQPDSGSGPEATLQIISSNFSAEVQVISEVPSSFPSDAVFGLRGHTHGDREREEGGGGFNHEQLHKKEEVGGAASESMEGVEEFGQQKHDREARQHSEPASSPVLKHFGPPGLDSMSSLSGDPLLMVGSSILRNVPLEELVLGLASATIPPDLQNGSGFCGRRNPMSLQTVESPPKGYEANLKAFHVDYWALSEENQTGVHSVISAVAGVSGDIRRAIATFELDTWYRQEREVDRERELQASASGSAARKLERRERALGEHITKKLLPSTLGKAFNQCGAAVDKFRAALDRCTDSLVEATEKHLGPSTSRLLLRCSDPSKRKREERKDRSAKEKEREREKGNKEKQLELKLEPGHSCDGGEKDKEIAMTKDRDAFELDVSVSSQSTLATTRNRLGSHEADSSRKSNTEKESKNNPHDPTAATLLADMAKAAGSHSSDSTFDAKQLVYRGMRGDERVALTEMAVRDDGSPPPVCPFENVCVVAERPPDAILSGAVWDNLWIILSLVLAEVKDTVDRKREVVRGRCPRLCVETHVVHGLLKRLQEEKDREGKAKHSTGNATASLSPTCRCLAPEAPVLEEEEEMVARRRQERRDEMAKKEKEKGKLHSPNDGEEQKKDSSDHIQREELEEEDACFCGCSMQIPETHILTQVERNRAERGFLSTLFGGKRGRGGGRSII